MILPPSKGPLHREHRKHSLCHFFSSAVTTLPTIFKPQPPHTGEAFSLQEVQVAFPSFVKKEAPVGKGVLHTAHLKQSACHSDPMAVTTLPSIERLQPRQIGFGFSGSGVVAGASEIAGDVSEGAGSEGAGSGGVGSGGADVSGGAGSGTGVSSTGSGHVSQKMASGLTFETLSFVMTFEQTEQIKHL